MKKLHFFDSLKFVLATVACVFAIMPAHAAILPAGYTELEYIQSTGTQYIDTERVPNNNDIIEQKFQKVGDSTTTCSWYGSMPSSQVVVPRISIGSYRVGTVLSIFAGPNYTGMLGAADTNAHTLRFQATGEKELTYTFDGNTRVMATTANMYEPAVELTSYLFARHGTNGVQVYDNEGTKIYYHREYLADGTLVLNMIPVKRNSDNALGMYDLADSNPETAFHTNAGTGTFVAGPAVPIKIATTRYNEQQFTPVETRLDAARTVINDLITQMQTNAVNVSKLAVEKQTRPNADCPAGKNCLLVTDPNGAENWYEIVGADAVQSSSNVPDYFSFTTTALNAGDSVGFRLTPSGTFTVDWGDGSVPQVIERTNTTSETYSHSYSNAGPKTVKITGRANGYSTVQATGVLRFGNASQIASIDGCLGAIFPTLGNASGQQPQFAYTFMSTQITSIPAGLFSGVTVATPYMFSGTFAYTQITSIPAGLFSGVTGAADYMFSGTFAETPITSIPVGLFSGITGAAEAMFDSTFAYTQITSIPAGLFSGVTGAADYMFTHTFAYTQITSIPENLFRGVNGAADYMFYSTFYSCPNLTGYIPESTFAALIQNNSPNTSNFMHDMFYGSTRMATACPQNTTEVSTPYKSAYWSTGNSNYAVMCRPN